VNQVIEDIERDGMTILPDGERVRIHSGVGPESGRVIRHAIEAASPTTGCEVGLAFGVSTLYILDAMRDFGAGRLIGMDPAQHDQTWRGGGLYNLQRAGLSDKYSFHEAKSQFVLPRLAEVGTRIQFAFVDGWHTFDHTLVDFFYLDLMMDVGGIVILDDVGYPALQRLAHFIVTNRQYSIFDSDPRPVTSTWRRGAKSIAQSICLPLVRDNHTPNKESRLLQEPVNRSSLIALRKCGDDMRTFDHFVPF
jgi:predicted O-methyltransferase YrrM